MRTIGSCFLLNVLTLLIAYFIFVYHGLFANIIYDFWFTVMLFGLFTSGIGLLLKCYGLSRLAYWLIMIGGTPLLPTGLLLIYFSRKEMVKLTEEADLIPLYGRLVVIAVPYIWMILLFLLPFLIVFKLSFAEMARAIPPFTDLITWNHGLVNIVLNFGNYLNLIDDTLYITAYLQSIKIAFVSTILCILIGYPLAWAISTCETSTRNVLLLLIILPSWTSFLIRVYAWIGILKNSGLLNNFLIWLKVIDEPIVILNTNIAVYIGIVYSYLPFVVLPIYNSLIKIDKTLIEAALDLGCLPIKAFFKVIVPLTKSGIIAGAMLVFIPAVGEYVIPELLGGSDTLMIGRVLWQEFFNNRDWPAASAVASVMLLILIVPIFYFNKYQNKKMEGK